MLKYCYPNLPSWIDPASVDRYRQFYIAEKKKNGWRCLAVRNEEGLMLWTRRHSVIKDALPITRGELIKLPIGTIIDGELLDKRTKNIKDHYYAFDIQFLEGKSVMHLSWKERRELLENTVQELDIEISEPIQIGFSKLYELAVKEGDEGIVIKNINSKYVVDLKDCPVNPQWFKAKKPENCFINKEA